MNATMLCAGAVVPYHEPLLHTLLHTHHTNASRPTQQCCVVLQSYRKMSPFCIPFCIANASSALLAMEVGFMGPNYNISTACATGNYCILK